MAGRMCLIVMIKNKDRVDVAKNGCACHQSSPSTVVNWVKGNDHPLSHLVYVSLFLVSLSPISKCKLELCGNPHPPCVLLQ